MNEERNYDDPRLSEEMRRYGCYTVPSDDPKHPHDAQMGWNPLSLRLLPCCFTVREWQ